MDDIIFSEKIAWRKDTKVKKLSACGSLSGAPRGCPRSDDLGPGEPLNPGGGPPEECVPIFRITMPEDQVITNGNVQVSIKFSCNGFGGGSGGSGSGGSGSGCEGPPERDPPATVQSYTNCDSEGNGSKDGDCISVCAGE